MQRALQHIILDSKIGTLEIGSGAGKISPSTRHRITNTYCTIGVKSIAVDPLAVHCFLEETVLWNLPPVSTVVPVAASW